MIRLGQANIDGKSRISSIYVVQSYFFLTMFRTTPYHIPKSEISGRGHDDHTLESYKSSETNTADFLLKAELPIINTNSLPVHQTNERKKHNRC